ncbi:hypothetical protein LOD99_15571 [Oopsacas minuta]|uniref:HAT C-terminal dimerisation domain-containing protein n=1 Tax=Oopsacas minuta TaxID=111878 RepID=A0AAV7KC80_9METZ|nr:hypothetical protein LOD99_15569 [Oopsacas minuta]KAI6658302.1 hypothetical protein LOD99_15571 [Oopsacas minuta]
MRRIESLKRRFGTKMMITNGSIKDRIFGIINLSSNRRHMCINADAFIDKLLDSMKDRLFATNAAGSVRTHDAYKNRIDEISVLLLDYWPQDICFDYGIEEVRSLCNWFSLARNSTVSASQDYVGNQGRRVPDDLYPLLRCCSCIPISSAECELGFSQMNLISTSTRNRLLSDRVSHLMIIKLHGPPIDSWNPDKYAKSWLREHHTADDQRVENTRGTKLT